MLFVCRPKFFRKHCLQFLLGVKMAPRETENNAYAKFGVTNKEHYGMLWYFLEWLIILHSTKSYPVYCKHSFIYLVDFLKTNLMKFAVYLSEKVWKGRFLKPEKLQNHSDEGRKRKSEEKKRRTTEKSNGCTLSFYNSYFKNSFWPDLEF